MEQGRTYTPNSIRHNYSGKKKASDIASIIGIITGFTLIFYALHEGGDLSIFWDPAAAMITFGGTFAAICMSYPISLVFRIFGLIIKVFSEQIRHPEEIAKDLVHLAYMSKQGGFLELEKQENQIGDKFLKYGISMVVDGLDPLTIRELMETEIESIRERHTMGQKVLRSTAAYGPSFGLLATIIGLIQLLSNLQSGPEGIGPAMALAMNATFYGVFMANLLFMPMAEKLENRMEEEIFLMKLICEGVIGLRKNINPKIIEKKLNAFLVQSKRFTVKGI